MLIFILIINYCSLLFIIRYITIGLILINLAMNRIRSFTTRKPRPRRRKSYQLSHFVRVGQHVNWLSKSRKLINDNCKKEPVSMWFGIILVNDVSSSNLFCEYRLVSWCCGHCLDGKICSNLNFNCRDSLMDSLKQWVAGSHLFFF